MGSSGDQNASNALHLVEAVSVPVDGVANVVVHGVNGVSSTLNKSDRGIAVLIEALVI